MEWMPPFIVGCWVGSIVTIIMLIIFSVNKDDE